MIYIESYTGAFEVAFPALQKEYESVLTQTIRRIPSLHRNWSRSPFASATFNLGPTTSTLRHRIILTPLWEYAPFTVMETSTTLMEVISSYGTSCWLSNFLLAVPFSFPLHYLNTPTPLSSQAKPVSHSPVFSRRTLSVGWKQRKD